jgi:Mg-chelatase subunit ChlD
MSDDAERMRRWRLAVGGDAEGLSERDARIDRALSELYRSEDEIRRAGLGGSAPRVARWLGDIREFFPAPVVQVMQRDAFQRLGLRQMLLEPELLATVEADVHLVADLIALRAVMPDKVKDTAREVVAKVVRELMARLEDKTVQAIRGALSRHQRTHRPRHADIDWGRTILKNLAQYLPQYRTVAPERLVGFGRRTRRVDLDQVVLCLDQSGSMAASVVYASIFGAVMASIPAVQTRLVVFDTAVADLSEDLADPVDLLFGVQLGGGTDINNALAYCERTLAEPSRTHLILITDLFEGGNAKAMLERAAALVGAGVNLIVLLSLSDTGRPAANQELGAQMAALGCPVFACTPDLFPDLMAAALRRDDITAWAAARDIALVRAKEA